MQVDKPTLPRLSPSARLSEAVCSTNASHYELQVEIGNPGFHIIDPSLLGIKLMAKKIFLVIVL